MPVGIFPVGLRVQRYYRRIAGLSDCFSLIRFDSLSYSFVTQLLSKYSVNPDFYLPDTNKKRHKRCDRLSVCGISFMSFCLDFLLGNPLVAYLV